MVRPVRFELTTFCSGGKRSIQTELRALCAYYNRAMPEWAALVGRYVMRFGRGCVRGRGGGWLLEQGLNHVAPIAFLILGGIVARRRGLRSNVPFAVDPHDLWHRVALHHVVVQVRHHFFRRAETHRVADVEVLHE